MPGVQLIQYKLTSLSEKSCGNFFLRAGKNYKTRAQTSLEERDVCNAKKEDQKRRKDSDGIKAPSGNFGRARNFLAVFRKRSASRKTFFKNFHIPVYRQ